MRATLSRLLPALAIFLAGNVLGAPNLAPTASITSPTTNTAFTAPAFITFTANASDPDGTVTKVEYFRGATSIGSAATPPYTVVWSNVVALGTYSITAKATDNKGKVGPASPAITVIVVAVPSAIASPAANAQVPAGPVLVTGTFAGSAATASVIVTAGGGHSVVATLSGNSFSASVPVSAGPNVIEVRVARPDGTFDAVDRAVTGTVAPVVALTAPTSCGPFPGPVTMTISADAATEIGTIDGVEFFVGGQSIGTISSPPYTTTRLLGVGDHTISATATNSFGAQASTPPFVVTVGSNNVPPTVSLTAPAHGSTYTIPSPIFFAATAADPDGDIDRVQFLANGSVVGTAFSPPYEATWSPTVATTYDLVARAFDNDGASTDSSPVRQVVVNPQPANQPPTVSITFPLNEATLDAGTSVSIVAVASDPDGSVTQVLFFVGNQLLGGSSGPTFSVSWNDLFPGTYDLTAVATDNRNDSTTSATVRVQVAVPTQAGETIVFLHNDFAGNPIAATSTTGAVLWKENYRPFGARLLNDAGALDNRQWFGGKAADSETGLSYFGARYYDATLGRFMGADAKGFSEKALVSFNRYAYAFDNPYRFVDPDGRWATAIHENSINRVLAFLPARDRQILRTQQTTIDANQANNVQFRHSLRIPGQTAQDAWNAANEFVRTEIQAARDMEKAGNHEEALQRLGNAMHTMQDATSPSHVGFRQWDNEGSAWEKLKHVNAEKSDPGPGSSLDDATARAWVLFRSSNPLPAQILTSP